MKSDDWKKFILMHNSLKIKDEEVKKMAVLEKPKGRDPDYTGVIQDLEQKTTHRISLWKYEPKKKGGL